MSGRNRVLIDQGVPVTMIGCRDEVTGSTHPRQIAKGFIRQRGQVCRNTCTNSSKSGGERSRVPASSRGMEAKARWTHTIYGRGTGDWTERRVHPIHDL